MNTNKSQSTLTLLSNKKRPAI